MPFILLSFYSFPQGDDFCYYMRAKDLGVFEAVKNWYFMWSGRYFSAFIQSITLVKLNFMENFYLVFMSTFLVLLFSIYKFLQPILQVKNPIINLNFALLISIMYFEIAPALNLGHYWSSGSTTYTLGLSFVLLFLSRICSSKKFSPPDYIYTALLITAAIGSSEVIMLYTLWICLFYLIMSVKNNTNVLTAFYFLCLTILCSWVVVGTPGNKLRIETFDSDVPIITSLFLSLQKGAFFIFRWILLNRIILPYLAIFIFYTLITYQDINKRISHKVNIKSFVKSALIISCVLWCQFFTVIVRTSPDYIPERTLNISVFVLNLFFLFFLAKLVATYYELLKSEKGKKVLIALISVALFSFVGNYLSHRKLFIPPSIFPKGNLALVIEDISSGNARANNEYYHRVINMGLIHYDGGIYYIHTSPYDVHVSSRLKIEDLKDQESFINECIASFIGVEHVKAAEGSSVGRQD
ncbi:hypothetical protein JXA34_01905 [Patescibacteria group bacterium]|nr:hypothetical protein [Patescibacteria group bacterium]